MALSAAAAALPLIAVGAVRRGWKAGAKVRTASGLRGASLAMLVLRYGGAKGVDVVEGGGLLQDRFKPGQHAVVLSRPVYDGRSLAALGHAALHAGMALEHAAGAKPVLRLESWSGAVRVFVNVAPPLALLLVLHPALLRMAPVAAAACIPVAVVQLLTLPAARAAAARARALVLEHRLLPPEELEAFQRALKSAAERHLAAPLLDCVWLRWMF
jgi:Zn-dependent membrane protease YugP